MKRFLVYLILFTNCVNTIAQNTGIGLTNPQSKLHILRGSSGYPGPYPHQDMIIESNDHTWINFLAPNNKEMGILFGKPSHVAHGGLIYDMNNNLQFRTNGNTTRMMLTATGNLGIGSINPSAKLTIHHDNDFGSPTLRLFDNGISGSPTIEFQNAGGTENWQIVGFVNNSNVSQSELVFQNTAGQHINIRGNGNVGIGTVPTSKLDVNGDINLRGPLKLNGTSGLFGQSLISTGTGTDPIWASINSNPLIGFSARVPDDINIASGVSQVITSFTETLDDGNGFNPATGEFTAPSTGLYHIEAIMRWSSPPAGNTYLALRFKNGPGLISYAESVCVYPAFPGYTFSIACSINVKLNIGDRVKIEVVQISGTTLTLDGDTAGRSVFSGFKVY